MDFCVVTFHTDLKEDQLVYLFVTNPEPLEKAMKVIYSALTHFPNAK